MKRKDPTDPTPKTAEQRRQRNPATSVAGALLVWGMLSLPLVLCGVLFYVRAYLPFAEATSHDPLPPERHGTRTILPAERFLWFYVLPDGRNILFAESQKSRRPTLRRLDAATSQEVTLAEDTAWGPWLDSTHLYGVGQYHYVLNVPSFSIVQLVSLSTNAPDIRAHALAADAVYVELRGSEGGQPAFNLYMLDLESGEAQGGYVVKEYIGRPDRLLAGIAYQQPNFEPPRDGLPNNPGPVYSPDGQYYYTCQQYWRASADDNALQIYSQQDTLLNALSAQAVVCAGWAWDNSGVYFQKWRHRGGFDIGNDRRGPLELLLVKP